MRNVLTPRLVIGTIITLLILVQLGYFAVLRFVPVDTLDVTQVPVIQNPGKTVVAGQAVQYKYRYCKHVALEARTSKVIIGAINYPLSVLTGNLPKGCGTAASSNTIIPAVVLPGMYRLQFTVTYRVNPLRTETAVFSSEYFTVVAPDGDATSAAAPVTTSTESTVLEPSSDDQGSKSTGTASSATPAISPASPQPTTPSPGLVTRLLNNVGGVVSQVF